MQSENGNISERVNKVLAEVLHVDREKIKPESSIQEDLGADSLDTVSLLMELEEEFQGEISDEEAAGLTTVKDITGFISKKAETEKPS